MDSSGGPLDVDLAGIAETVRAAGVAGAGGAGFPSYVKWTDLEDIDHLMVNHHESEPCYYADKWLGRERADALGRFVGGLLETTLDAVVVGTKAKYLEEGWLDPLIAATDATVCGPEDLPVDVDESAGVTFACTPDVYTYSEERVLLRVAAGVGIGEDLPTDHGWIVHNTETLWNIYRATADGAPVTRKYVHVDGSTPSHRCLDVPIGTTASTLLEAAGLEDDTVSAGQVLADGGPGWCYEIDEAPGEFGVRKRTNAVLVLDEDLVRDHTQEDGQIDVLAARDWGPNDGRPHETEPARITPDQVRIPRITNAAYTGLVAPSEPAVAVGDEVSIGDVIATPGDGISIPQHASIDGTITGVTDTHIVIEE
jgi:Na+-translocating ferredoxin:NAD+ oxidoreductase RnfC subunit